MTVTYVELALDTPHGRVFQSDAQHLLHVVGYPGGVAPGHFMTSLVEALVKADTSNQDRLALGFPSLVAAYRHYAYSDGGSAELVALARGEAGHRVELTAG